MRCTPAGRSDRSDRAADKSVCGAQSRPSFLVRVRTGALKKPYIKRMKERIHLFRMVRLETDFLRRRRLCPKNDHRAENPRNRQKRMRVLAWVASLFLAGGFVYLMFRGIQPGRVQHDSAERSWRLPASSACRYCLGTVPPADKDLGEIASGHSVGCAWQRIGSWRLVYPADRGASFPSLVRAIRRTIPEKTVTISDSQTNAILDDAAGLGEKMAVTVTTYSTKGYDLKDPASLSGKRIGTVPTLDEEGTKAALAQLESKGMKRRRNS